MEQQQRLVAYKVKIKHIHNSEFVKQEGWKPDYIKVGDYEVSRVNLIGAVISNEKSEGFKQMILDDGTGKVTIRSFEENAQMEDCNVGELINLIGRVRLFGNERYLIPDIIKKITNPKWINYINAEVEMFTKGIEFKTQVKEEAKIADVNFAEEEIMSEESDSEKVYNLIKKLDMGQGADYQEVVESSGIKNTEQIITEFMLNGDVFEVKPGKLKILQ